MAALVHSIADIIRQLVVDLGAGTDPEDGTPWPSYATTEPDGSEVPDEVITSRKTTAVVGPRAMQDGTYSQAEGFQVRVRAGTPAAAEVKAREIMNLFDQLYNVDVVVTDPAPEETYVIQSIGRTSDPIDISQTGTPAVRGVYAINGVAYLQD